MSPESVYTIYDPIRLADICHFDWKICAHYDSIRPENIYHLRSYFTRKYMPSTILLDRKYMPFDLIRPETIDHLRSY